MIYEIIFLNIIDQTTYRGQYPISIQYSLRILDLKDIRFKCGYLQKPVFTAGIINLTNNTHGVGEGCGRKSWGEFSSDSFSLNCLNYKAPQYTLYALFFSRLFGTSPCLPLPPASCLSPPRSCVRAWRTLLCTPPLPPPPAAGSAPARAEACRPGSGEAFPAAMDTIKGNYCHRRIY